MSARAKFNRRLAAGELSPGAARWSQRHLLLGAGRAPRALGVIIKRRRPATRWAAREKRKWRWRWRWRWRWKWKSRRPRTRERTFRLWAAPKAPRAKSDCRAGDEDNKCPSCRPPVAGTGAEELLGPRPAAPPIHSSIHSPIRNGAATSGSPWRAATCCSRGPLAHTC